MICRPSDNNPAPRRWCLLLFIAALSLCVSAAAGRAYAAPRAVVKEIRHWSNPSYTRVVISLDRKAAYAPHLLKKDPKINKPWRRLYIDIKGARLGPGIHRAIHIDDGLLKKARAGQYDRDTVRVVLDTESIEDYKIFPLSDPFRIVIDVTGGKGALPAAGRASTAKKPVPSTEGASLREQLGLKVRTIVIDAGHGGRDPGAVGKRGLKEKTVTLKIARMLKARLKKDLDAKIILTRKTDVYIPLEERTAIANSRDADLFISIHINSSPRRAASGVETYILNISNNDEAKRVAARENATSTRSASDLEYILSDLIKTVNNNDSARLAESVHGRLVSSLKSRYSKIRSNGVKGAPFYVLVGTKMPSILVEASFISNPREERRLRDQRYLRTVVDGIAEGVIRYIKQINDQGVV